MSLEKSIVAEINRRCACGMIKALGLEFTTVADTTISARFQVTESLLTPMGLLHGGASLAVAESVAGVGSILKCEAGTMPVGSQVVANHVSSARLGQILSVTGTVLHIGKKTHLWNIDIVNESGALVSTLRVTNHIVPVEK
ncbi:MAG: PaaI family thioesterase [Opitutales bacterium]|nr:PaaI family thioesterase [Opitutales bacterium]